MRGCLAVTALGIRQNLRSPLIIGLLVLAPIMLVFVLGEALRTTIPAENPFDFIATIIVVQAVVHGSVIGFWGIQKDVQHHTADRIAVAPLSATARIAGAFLASFVSLTAFATAVVLGLAGFLRVNIGTAPGLLFLTLACSSAFSAGFGTFLAALMRDSRSASSVLSIAVPVLIMLGGAYFPLPDHGPIAAISPFTPIRWVNDALRALLGAATQTDEWRTVLLCPVVALALVAAATALVRRRNA